MKRTLVLLMQLVFIAFFNFTSCKNGSNTMSQDQLITKYDTLAQYEGQEVSVCGIYKKHDPIPNLRRKNIEYLSGLLLEGDTIPKLFIENPRLIEEQNKFDGKKVKLSGIFYTIQPLEEGGYSGHSARYMGSWIYDVSTIELVNE